MKMEKAWMMLSETQGQTKTEDELRRDGTYCLSAC